jgi:hypothetical protein
MTCPRCGGDAALSMMSMFNTDMCCLECIEKEKQHPKYKEAVAADEAAISKGDYNYAGIGWSDGRN